MRLRVSCICLTLRQGTLISIVVDILKIIASISLLVVYATTGYDRGVSLQTQTVSAPQKLTDGSVQGQAIVSVIVVFIGDLVRYSVVGAVGLVVFFKHLKSIYLGTYFWTKFLQSFLNIFSSLLMVTLVQLPFSDMIQSLASFALDQYFCLIVYSYWQAKKIDEGIATPFDDDTSDEEELQSHNHLEAQNNRNSGIINKSPEHANEVDIDVNQHQQQQNNTQQQQHNNRDMSMSSSSDRGSRVNANVSDSSDNNVGNRMRNSHHDLSPSDSSTHNNQPYLRRDTDVTIE
eukprot:403370160